MALRLPQVLLLLLLAALLVVFLHQVALIKHNEPISNTQVFLAENTLPFNRLPCRLNIFISAWAVNGDFSNTYKLVSLLNAARTKSFAPCLYIAHAYGNNSREANHLYSVLKPFDIVEFLVVGTNPRNGDMRVDMLDLLQHTATMAQEQFILVLQDTMVLCKHAQYQLLKVMDDADKHLNKKFIGIRIAAQQDAASGIVFLARDAQQMVNYLHQNRETMAQVGNDKVILHWWTMNQQAHNKATIGNVAVNMTASHNKMLYTYKYQLLVHQQDASKCLEPNVYTTDSPLETTTPQCFASSLYSPCDRAVQNDQPDAFHLPKLSAQHTYSELLRASLEQCSQSCTACCQGKGKSCKPDLLPYANRCDLFPKHACQQETQQCTTAPTLVGNVYYLVARPSRFACDSVPGKEEVRICPCG